MSGDCANYAAINPDISGVGVRISFYLQTFILVLLVDRSWQDAPIALWTFIATSFGLTAAAIVQREQLTLFQALQVSNLVWLANFGTFVSLASYSRQKAASHKKSSGRRPLDYNVKFGAMAQTLLSMALTLYMWTNAKTFGRQPDCSPFVKFMFFVVEVPALGIGRTLSLVITSVLTAVYCTITLLELHSYCRIDIVRSWILSARSPPSNRSLPTPGSTHPLPDTTPSSATPITSPQIGQHARNPQRYAVSRALNLPHVPKFHKRRPERRRWSCDLDPMLVGIIICQAMVFTYFIVSSELLLKNNPSLDDSAAQWSFGQILALVVVVPSALSLIGAVMRHGARRLSDHNKRFAKEKDKRLQRRKDRQDKAMV